MRTATQARAYPAREKDDFYRTPPHCTEALLRAERLPSGAIWEPACGDGAIASVLESVGHKVVSTDLVDRGFGTSGVDFLLTHQAPPDVLGIVTNPPYKLAAEFALHSIRLGVPYLAMLLRLAWLEGAARHTAVFTPHPPSRVWVFRKRPTLWRGDEPPNGSGTTAYAWFVWDSKASTNTQLGWL